MERSKERRTLTCGTCFFNGGSPAFLHDANKLLCHREPPSAKQGADTLRHIYPVVHVDAKCCAGWRDKETLETLDDVMEEIVG